MENGKHDEVILSAVILSEAKDLVPGSGLASAILRFAQDDKLSNRPGGRMKRVQ